ncbi:MAG TPA: hypothetical protein VGS19_22410 [Streptosporangiaceae bacterium]|nr:hypothetical protein [Streptosporangiaceae bacterium]
MPEIAAQYEKVIEKYSITRIDLDTEENSLNNYAGIDRRNKAIAMVEKWAATTGHTVQFVYTLPTNTTGPDQGGSYILQNAVANNAKITIVNVMTFDYYDNMPHEMGDETEGAAQQLFNRLHELFPADPASRIWGMIGVTEDIGVDDFGPAETLTTADAATVERWAAIRGLGELSFWNIQRDNAHGSGVTQTKYQFSHAWEPFTSSVPDRVSAASAPGAGTPAAPDPQHGNFRSVSCPTTTFCMAVDQSGNNALRWNGTTWSAPGPIDPGASRLELNSVSCITADFCVAVDSRGNALRWNGTTWSAPDPIDPHGAGFTSVSCGTATFCVAVDGHGDALRWNGTTWSKPVRIDPDGTALQSVSCAGTFCAAGDWNGDALTFNGTSWPAPQAVDPTAGTTGGGLSSMSCVSNTFCVATDWYGAEVTWNGTRWSKPDPFNPNGSQGLMSVSCLSTTFCMVVDGGGDYLIWNGTNWTSPTEVDPTGDGLESVSCAAATACMAVDWLGNALTWNGTSWTSPAVSCPDSTPSGAGNCTVSGSYTDPRAGALDAVSCAPGTASFCAAVDGNGEALTATGGGGKLTWSAPAPADPIAGILSSVSCPAADFCAAVDTNGNTLTWNGTAWSHPVWSTATAVDPAGGPLSSVSCTSKSMCVAVDTNGNALTWNGTAWSTPAVIDPADSLTSVSCTGTFCAAVDANGNVTMTTDDSVWSAPKDIAPSSGGLTGCRAPRRRSAPRWAPPAMCSTGTARPGPPGGRSTPMAGSPGCHAPRMCPAPWWTSPAMT